MAWPHVRFVEGGVGAVQCNLHEMGPEGGEPLGVGLGDDAAVRDEDGPEAVAL